MEQQATSQGKVRRFLKETRRVLHITKKPNRQEFMSLFKITGIGVALIGLIGFVIFIVKQLLL